MAIRYALALAAGALPLKWLEYKYVTRGFAPEFYVVLIALGFTALGLWAGNRLPPRARAPGFQRNAAALKSLGVTDREVAVLELLAAGSSNKEIARSLDISPSSVKTHIANLVREAGGPAPHASHPKGAGAQHRSLSRTWDSSRFTLSGDTAPARFGVSEDPRQEET